MSKTTQIQNIKNKILNDKIKVMSQMNREFGGTLMHDIRNMLYKSSELSDITMLRKIKLAAYDILEMMTE